MRKVAGDVKCKKKNLNGDLPYFLTKTTNLPKMSDIKYALIKRSFLISHNIKLIWGFKGSLWRNRQDHMRNRFYASFHIAENPKHTP